MSRRPLLALVLAAALFTPGLTADAAPRIPVLAGTVRIFATTSTTIDVKLPKNVYIGDGYHPPKGTSVTGAGRTIGAMLLKADLSLQAMDVIRYHFCGTPGCSSKITKTWFHGSDGTGPIDKETLGAGIYRLLVITDGKPVTVVLKFPGLKGKLDLRPTRPMHVKHQSPTYLGSTGAVAPGTPGTYYSGSVPVSVDSGRGILLHQFYVETDITAQQQGGFCMYPAAVAAEPAPECPAGSGTDITITQLKPDGGQWAMTGRWRYIEPGDYRAGGYYRTVGLAHDPFGTITTIVLPPQQV